MHTGTFTNEMNNAVDRATGTRPIHTKVPMMPVGFGVSPELFDSMLSTAKECGTSIAELCRVAVQAYITHLEDEASKYESDMERARR